MSSIEEIKEVYLGLASKFLPALDLLISGPQANYDQWVDDLSKQYVDMVLDIAKGQGPLASPSVVRVMSLQSLKSYEGPLDGRSRRLAMDAVGDYFDRAVWKEFTSRFPALAVIPASIRSDMFFWTVFSLLEGQAGKPNADLHAILKGLPPEDVLSKLCDNLERFMRDFASDDMRQHMYQSRILDVIQILSAVSVSVPETLRDRVQLLRAMAEKFERRFESRVGIKVLN